MKMKVSGSKLREWIKEIKILFRNPKFVGLVTVAIITVSLPITIITLNTNTDNRQHASSDCPAPNSNNYHCGYSNPHTSTPQNFFYPPDPNGNHYCASNAFCDSSLCYQTKPACVKIVNCICDQQGAPAGSFTCNGGKVQRACGQGLYCDNNSLQGGIWPCSRTQPTPPPPSCTSSSVNGECIKEPSTCPNGYTGSNNGYQNESCGNGYYCCVPDKSRTPKYRCSGDTCVQDDTNGTFTDSSCNNTCDSRGGTEDKRYNECDTDPNFGACGGLVTEHNGPTFHLVTHNTDTGWACHDDTSTPCLSTISGHVFIDTNGNGTQDSGEPNVTSDKKTTLTLIPGNVTVTTDNQGNFTFGKTGKANDVSLLGGDYTLEITTPPAGYSATTDKQTVAISFDKRNASDLALGIQIASSPTPTDTPIPSDTPIPPDPSKTTGNISLQFEGISATENPTPLHPNRQIILYFYPPTDTSFQQTPYVSPVGIVTYNNATGYFSNANFPLKGLSAGKYLVLVRSLDGSLVSQMGTGDGTGPITITTTGDSNLLVDTQDTSDQNADTTIPKLKMGDIVISGNSFNIVDTLDYSTFVDCYGNDPSHMSDACFKHQGIIDIKTQVFLPDLNDDGKINGVDYTILERNYGHYGVGGSTMNRGNDPTKK